jgi:hypothetical protein
MCAYGSDDVAPPLQDGTQGESDRRYQGNADPSLRVDDCEYESGKNSACDPVQVPAKISEQYATEENFLHNRSPSHANTFQRSRLSGPRIGTIGCRFIGAPPAGASLPVADKWILCKLKARSPANPGILPWNGF